MLGLGSDPNCVRVGFESTRPDRSLKKKKKKKNLICFCCTVYLIPSSSSLLSGSLLSLYFPSCCVLVILREDFFLKVCWVFSFFGCSLQKDLCDGFYFWCIYVVLLVLG